MFNNILQYVLILTFFWCTINAAKLPPRERSDFDIDEDTILYDNNVNHISMKKRSFNSEFTNNTFDFDDVIPSKFPLRGFNGTWMTGDEFLYRSSEGDYKIFNVITNTERIHVAASILQQFVNVSSYVFSPDFQHILVRYNVRTVFRHSTVAQFKIYDITNGIQVDVSFGEELQLCRWSPVSNNLAYVKKNNVYYRLNGGIEYELTSDGIPGVIYNGVPDWVYEEEVFGTDGAIWFSPDSTKLAIASFDDTDVEIFKYYLYGEPGNIENQYPEEISIRYPKAGRTNPTVKLQVIDLQTLFLPPYNWIEIKAPVETVSNDPILTTVAWAGNSKILATWVNRRQNLGVTISCDASSAYECKEEISMSEPEGWLEPKTPKCNSDGSICFLIQSVDNWPHIVKHTLSDSVVTNMTWGTFTVLNIYGHSESTNDIFYLSTSTENPDQRFVFKVNSEGTECLSCQLDEPCTYASASFSKDFTWYALTCFGPGPAITKIHKVNSAVAPLVWEENLATRELLKKYENHKIIKIDVPVGGGFHARVAMYMPPEIDYTQTIHAKKYPMIVYVYGGPNSVRVSDNLSFGYQNYLTTTRKVIYCMIDGRGSGNKGDSMLFTLNNHLGTVEIEDQISVTEELTKRYSFIDSDRVGIWGWSYGGYATAMVLARDAKKVFQCGISVAPVTSWIYYDSIYTERFMGLPTAEDNLVGYNASDVTRLVDNMKSHDFLLIHGNADDNVHYQQSMALSRALQKAEILFEQMSYPDEAHSLSGVQKHLYHTMDQFWTDCLNIAVDEE